MIEIILFMLLIPFNVPMYKMIKEVLFLDQEEFQTARTNLLSALPLKTPKKSKRQHGQEQVKLSLFYLICLCLLVFEFCLMYDIIKHLL